MTTIDDALSTLASATPSIAELASGLEAVHGLSTAESPITVRTLSANELVRWDPRAIEDADDIYFNMLKRSLHAAVKLEFATIPPYLCALWSVKNELHEVAKSIREVVQEEMFHLALAANMLTAIGGTPRFNDDVPAYPGRLPGGVHPDLVVKLRGLSKPALKAFMQIEEPEEIVPHGHVGGRVSEESRTIGRFYAAIGRAFAELKPTFRADRQISGPLAEAVVENVDDVHRAIQVIRGQGEGSNATPFDSGPEDLSHYYRFEELYDGRRLDYDPTSKTIRHGATIAWPECWPMKATPKGGYRRSAVSENAWVLLQRFDEVYSQMLDCLQSAWTVDGQTGFLRAIELMFALESYAKPLMQIEVPTHPKQTLGPCFRYIRVSDRTFVNDAEVRHAGRQ